MCAAAKRTDHYLDLLFSLSLSLTLSLNTVHFAFEPALPILIAQKTVPLSLLYSSPPVD